ncbi:uncharacterized protein LOC113273138 [Papaver somniferum]|uniref:uncharacterized protein LOC113273138 n=1 Tax=Papaver somniferum TaxID=3469 RepID=UPI000E702942|nr:uncharacterized protein LOC113273138 [Papaver somniferum]
MLESMSLQRVNQFGFQNSFIVSSVGGSGGLWLPWKEEIQIYIISKSSNFIHVVVNRDSCNSWHLFCIYVPLITTQGARFGENMTQHVQNFDGCKCVIEDIYAMCSKDEKFGGFPILNSNISYFNNFIQQNHLVDLGYNGPAYTCTNGYNIEGLICQCLDRAVANPVYASILHIPRLASDHPPILLNTCRNISRSPRDYKFEAMWLSQPELFDNVSKWSRRRIACIKHKIAFLKTKLLKIQSWRSTTTNIQSEKLLMTELNIMEATYWDQHMKRKG